MNFNYPINYYCSHSSIYFYLFIHKIRNYFREIFQNINLSLYLLGICYENLGQLSKALDCYKQASWFISKFYHESNSKFYEIIQGTEILASKYNDFLMEKIRNRDNEIERGIKIFSDIY